MSFAEWALWGFAATVVLTTILAGSQGLGLTRMSIPFLLGTLFTPRRDRAKAIGVAVHLVNGWLFALLYLAAFHAWGGGGLLRGAAIGTVHALFVLTVVMPIYPAFHPRMKTEHHGPSVRRQLLEPPGFLALHYGYQTPITVLVSHVVYGMVLGAFYRFS
jgi:uncharacterized membrane protein YagU involved in acid resistance